ncbi:DUF4157 domain-containing protein [bacterium]|nr:DUF4157 domain-containing protein [bacterium]
MAKSNGRKRVRRVRKKSSTTRGGPFFRGLMKSMHAKGEPLKESTRRFFEQRMGTRFGNVRLHRDQEASSAAQELGARAFTYGDHVVLNKKYLTGDGSPDRALLAHELRHVQQQRSGSPVLQMAPESSTTEQEAVKSGTADKAAPGKAAEAQARQEEEDVMQPVVLPDFMTKRAPSHMAVAGKTISVTGKTDADFDGGVGRTKNLKGVPNKSCKECADDCYTITGTLVITYSVNTTVSLPAVPGGLTPCQQDRVKAVIDGKIAPHEQQHVAAFSTYNGVVSLPINYTGCKTGLEAHVQAMHDANAAARETAAKKKSDALDPFNVPIDLDCEDDDGKK